jgi:N-acetylmuramoyl-L-alanine amidase
MSSGSFHASSGSDSKRQRVLPVPKAAANTRTFEPDSSIVSDIIPSPNHGERNKGRQPDMIVLHYTGMPDVEGALARLCTAGTEVSAHYVVLEDGRIVQCVPEAKRAWHAGVSSLGRRGRHQLLLDRHRDHQSRP